MACASCWKWNNMGSNLITTHRGLLLAACWRNCCKTTTRMVIRYGINAGRFLNRIWFQVCSQIFDTNIVFFQLQQIKEKLIPKIKPKFGILLLTTLKHNDPLYDRCKTVKKRSKTISDHFFTF
uniref:(northern house mosquito) hypothetical protein n=1 Tax=Culex pipiens TaxID=7175 RepID=A0A8D8IBG9_CULPI